MGFRTTESPEAVGRRSNEGDLPRVGEVYLADTIVFSNGDHAEVRPVVVVRAARRPVDYVTVLQRTSTCFELPGVDHPRSAELGLDRDGRWIFDYQRSLPATEFVGHAFELRGSMSEVEVAALLEAWEAQP